MRKTLLLATLLIGALGSASSMNTPGLSKFMRYLAQHGKAYYNLGEFNFRLQNFNELDQWIEEYNSNPVMTSSVGHNLFSDWSQQERDKLFGSTFQGQDYEVNEENQNHTNKNIDINALPIAYTWLGQGTLSQPFFGGNCTASFAQAAVAASQSNNARMNNKTSVTYYSNQQAVSCYYSSTINTCSNFTGNPGEIFRQMGLGKGLALASIYPYTNQNDPNSQLCDSTIVGNLTTDYVGGLQGFYWNTGFANGTNADVNRMRQFVWSGISVALIDASSRAFQQYKSGILTAQSGCGSSGNAWVPLIGYYTSALTVSYWTIQGFFGPDWGVAGYANIAIDYTPNSVGVCGVQQFVQLPAINA